MANVPDHLTPQDGLTDATLRFDALEVLHDTSGARVTFGIYDEDGQSVGNFSVDALPPRGKQVSVNEIIADAHRQMTDILRQWLYVIDKMRVAYEEGAGFEGDEHDEDEED